MSKENKTPEDRILRAEAKFWKMMKAAAPGKNCLK